MIREANIHIQIIEKRVYIDIHRDRNTKCCGNLKENNHIKNNDSNNSVNNVCSVTQACLTLRGATSGSSAHGISQARILEWVAIPFSRGSF